MGIRIDPQAADRVLVSEVVPCGTAAVAGVVAGDTVVGIAGRVVTTSDTLRAALRDVCAGQTIRIDVLRQGAPVALPVTLADRREAVEGSTVSYRSVVAPNGYRATTVD